MSLAILAQINASWKNHFHLILVHPYLIQALGGVYDNDLMTWSVLRRRTVLEHGKAVEVLIKAVFCVYIIRHCVATSHSWAVPDQWAATWTGKTGIQLTQQPCYTSDIDRVQQAIKYDPTGQIQKMTLINHNLFFPFWKAY